MPTPHFRSVMNRVHVSKILPAEVAPWQQLREAVRQRFLIQRGQIFHARHIVLDTSCKRGRAWWGMVLDLVLKRLTSSPVRHLNHRGNRNWIRGE